MAYVQNPPVPYVGPLPPLQQNSLVQICGQIPPQAKWFAINLQCGPRTNPRDDIALHINPRFEGNLSKIVRNSLTAQQWGMEENFGHFPLAPGQSFELLMLIEHDHFKIAINGQHYTEFRYRMPIQRVTTLAIDGDVILLNIRCDAPSTSMHSGSSQAMPMPPHSPQPSHSPQPQYYGAHAGGYGQPIPGGYATQQNLTPAGYGLPPGPTVSYGYGQSSLGATSTMPISVPSGSYNYHSPHSMSAPMPVPGHSPMSGRKSPSMMPGIVAGAGAGLLSGAAGYGLAKLMYPHGNMGGMRHGMKFKHKWHKPKFHKFPKHKGFKHKWSHKWHKGWKHGGWGSHSSSSSEESE